MLLWQFFAHDSQTLESCIIQILYHFLHFLFACFSTLLLVSLSLYRRDFFNLQNNQNCFEYGMKKLKVFFPLSFSSIQNDLLKRHITKSKKQHKKLTLIGILRIIFSEFIISSLIMTTNFGATFATL
jgi:hypothetical protein